MLAPWARDEMATVDLDDARLNDRLTRLLSDLGSRPTASIPAACGGYNEMTAAYRFFDNDKTTPEKVLRPHAERTRQRMAEQEVVLLVQDTSELDLTRPRQQVRGAGPLDSSQRRGSFVHPLHAFTPDGTPLGTAWCRFWERDDEPVPLSAAQKRAARRAAPIEEKESLRWLEGLRQARELAQQLPGVRCVCIADSEADVYELFAEPRGEQPVHWLIRACQDRALKRAPEASSSLLRQRALGSPVLFSKKITVRGRQAKTACEARQRRQPRETRQAVVEVRAVTVTLRPPPRADRQLPAVSVNVVLVSEVSPPAGEPAVEWLLVTTLPIDTVDQVRQVVEYYCARWKIEVFFRVLKSGCRVEQRRFERLDRLLCCAAVYLIVAWRVLYVCRLGRSIPDLDCEAVFEPSEWKSVWVTVHREAPPGEPPSLAEVVALIAQLGGYINRPNRKDPPGVQTIWIGMQRMYDFAIAWDTFGPGAKKTSKLPILV
jgi:hypothetical protein